MSEGENLEEEKREEEKSEEEVQPEESPEDLDVTQAISIDLDWDAAPANLTPQKTQDVPTLVVQYPEADGAKVEEFSLAEGRTLQVGRSSGDIVISHRSVSATHCSLAVMDGTIFLSDENSTNGTFLNKQKLKPRRQVIASDGDEIYIGQVQGQIRLPESQQGDVHEDSSKEGEGGLKERPSGAKTKDGRPKIELDPGRKKKKKEKKIRPKRTSFKGVPMQREGKPLAGPLVRLWALLGDASLCYILESLLRPMPFAQVLQRELVQIWPRQIVNIIQNLPQGEGKLLAELSFGVFIFYAVRILSVLLLGASPVQAAMGMRGGHGFLYNRLGGVLRVGWEFLLSIFLIFDLPLLWKKRSLKEFLSGTKIVKGPVLAQLVSGVVVVPLLLALSFFGDFFAQWNYRNGFALTDYKQPTLGATANQKGEGSGPRASFLELTSKAFQFSSFPSIDEREELLLLGQTITSKNKKKTFRPRLALFNRKSKQGAELVVHSRNNLRQVLQESFFSDMFLAEHYPALAARLRGKRVEALTEGPLAKKTKAELKKFLQQSFSLDLGGLFAKVVKGDFAFNGSLKLRKAFIERFSLGPRARLQWAQLNNHLFLRIDPNSPPSPLAGYRDKVYFVPADTFNGPIYELHFIRRDRGEVVATRLLGHLFGEGQFYFDRPPPTTMPVPDMAENDITFGQCVDFLLSSTMSYEQIVPVYRRYLSYVTAMVDLHLRGQGSDEERKFLQRQLSSLSEMDALLSKRHPQWAGSFSGRGFQAQLIRLEQ